VAIGPKESLGRTYVFMVVAALAAISIDQTVTRTPASSARIVLDGSIGAAMAVAVLKLVGFARRWQ
jgi:phosphate/sulfate permease